MKAAHLALVLALLANASANILLKSGAKNLHLGTAEPSAVLREFLQNKAILAGLLLFAMNIVSYSYVLSKLPLSVAYPIMTSSGFVLVTIASVLLFQESISNLHLIGMIMIMIGVMLVSSTRA